MKSSIKQKNYTQTLVYTAVLAALSLCLRALPMPPGMHGMLRFSALPVILSGFLLSPKSGFWTGVISDLLGCMLFPIGPYFPGFTLTNGLTGFIPAFLCRQNRSLKNIMLSTAVCQLLTSFFLVPICLHILYGFTDSFIKTWQLLALPTLLVQAVHVPLYAWSVHKILTLALRKSNNL